MPLWGLTTSKRPAVELDSDDDRVSASTSSRSSSSVAAAPAPTAAAAAGRMVSPRPQPATVQRAASPLPQQQPAPAQAPAPAAGSNSFTSGAMTGPRSAFGIARRPMLLGVPSPSQTQVPLTVQAVHQRALSAQQPSYPRSTAGSSVNELAINTPRAQSLRSSRGGSFAFSPRVLESYNTMNLLVIGAPQVGKSLFINTYRAAVTNTTRWPAAPVGVSGFYGTTTVEPFPNHPREPTWLCIDTPGRLYNTESEVILEKLTEGIPWKTKLLGPKALSLSQVAELTPIAANRAHQCIIVVPATDLIEDEGWMSTLLWRTRYRPTEDVAGRILYIKNLVSSLRAMMNDLSPFVVVTKMDKFGGAGSSGACAAVTSILSQCVPVNRIYFTAAVENRAMLAAGRAMVLESSTKQNLVRLHEDICLAVQWSHQVEAL